MNPSTRPTARTLPGPGQPLRGDRIHRYVTAFCPRCHETNPRSHRCVAWPEYC